MRGINIIIDSKQIQDIMNTKKLSVFESNTYKNIQEQYNTLYEEIKKYIVLGPAFTEQLDKLKELINNTESNYNKELDEWLKNPQNTCEHINCRHKYVGHGHNFDVYELVCQDCGKVLGTYQS